MAAIPGPLGTKTNSPKIDPGTLVVARSSTPGPVTKALNDPENTVRHLLQSLVRTAHGMTHDFSTKKGTIEAIKCECIYQGIGLNNQIAYVLATTDHETNHTFKPVKEAYWLKDPDAYLKKHHANYYPYYGRGFVQLTWKSNYEKYGKLLDENLVGVPDSALEPEVALFVLVHGFKNGTFSGRKLSTYVNHDLTDFINARRCINGLDKAPEIAAIAKQYLARLELTSSHHSGQALA